jgi:hypothetical protein
MCAMTINTQQSDIPDTGLFSEQTATDPWKHFQRRCVFPATQETNVAGEWPTRLLRIRKVWVNISSLRPVNLKEVSRCFYVFLHTNAATLSLKLGQDCFFHIFKHHSLTILSLNTM